MPFNTKILVKSAAAVENPLLELTMPNPTFLKVSSFIPTLQLARVTKESPEATLLFCQKSDRARPICTREELLKRLGKFLNIINWLGENRELYVLKSISAMVTDLPLATVFVALSSAREVPERIESILEHELKMEGMPATALFYSISSPWREVAGLGLGKRLILETKGELQKKHPSLKTFCTMSPALSFGIYLQDRGHDQLYSQIQTISGYSDVRIKELRPRMLELAREYILRAKDDKGNPLNAMTRFHCGNGAAVYRLNWPGDLTESGKFHSAGLLVNYLYDEKRLEERSKTFLENGSIDYLDGQLQLQH